MVSTDVTTEEFRLAMGRFATGVTVVTTIYDGQPYGLTVNAFCAVSLDPPLVSVALQRTSRTLAKIERSGGFAVNVLSAAQRDLAERFARKGPEDAPFEGVPYYCGIRVKEAALFDQALATVECAVRDIYSGGDHVIALGEVMAVEQGSAMRFAAPLLFYQSTLRAGNLSEVESKPQVRARSSTREAAS